MKAISLWQPWASLLAFGAKKYETRSWETAYRGPIAFHAAKTCFGPYACELPIGLTDAVIEAFWPGCNDPCAITDNWDELPRGEIIATAELIGCHRMQIDTKTHRISLYDSRGNQSSISLCSKELLFGDWRSGRFAWEFANMTMLPEPIPARGRQGIWNWEAVE